MRPNWTAPGSNVPIAVGVLVTLGGFGTILYTWYEVARIVLVPAQLPYLVSGGLTGLCLVLVGLTIVNVQVKRAGSAARVAQLEQLTTALLARDARAADDDDEDAPPTQRLSRSVWEVAG